MTCCIFLFFLGSQTPSEPHIKPLWHVAWRVVNLQDVAPTESLDEPWKTKGWNAQRWRFGSDEFPLNNSVIVTFHVNFPGCIVICTGRKCFGWLDLWTWYPQLLNNPLGVYSIHSALPAGIPKEPQNFGSTFLPKQVKQVCPTTPKIERSMLEITPHLTWVAERNKHISILKIVHKHTFANQNIQIWIKYIYIYIYRYI